MRVVTSSIDTTHRIGSKRIICFKQLRCLKMLRRKHPCGSFGSSGAEFRVPAILTPSMGAFSPPRLSIAGACNQHHYGVVGDMHRGLSNLLMIMVGVQRRELSRPASAVPRQDAAEPSPRQSSARRGGKQNHLRIQHGKSIQTPWHVAWHPVRVASKPSLI